MYKNIAHISYHISVIFLSAALAISVPYMVSTLADSLLNFWTLIEDEKIFLVALEILMAVVLILFFNAIMRGREYRRIANMAKSAGLVLVSPSRGLFSRRRIRRMKKELGFARELMIIGSTGYKSLLNQEGDLHEALLNCREAKIMLLNPLKEGASTRARSIPEPGITTETIQEQIIKSINFLKSLRAAQKRVRLKLYPDLPLLKLVIAGDYAFLRHYRPDIHSVPEFAFRNEPKQGGLYVPLYQYFLSRWQGTDSPEYDFDTDELVYRDCAGNEVRRERFDIAQFPIPSDKDRTSDRTIYQRLFG